MRPPEIQNIIDELERSAPNASVDELNRLLSARMNEYNSRPQAELGGLSPDSMGQLLYGGWEGHGVMRLDETLTLEELDASAFLSDARTVLQHLDTEGAVKETDAGNLPRAVVATLRPNLRMPETPEPGWPEGKNESDVPWLQDLRYTLLFAKLIVRRKGLRLTARGRELLREKNAGVLFAHLFRTLFRDFDLRSLDNSDRYPELQSTIPYALFKLGAVREWSSRETVIDIAWLRHVSDPAPETEVEEILRNYTFDRRVLDPLVQFGLLERRELPTANRWERLVEYRSAPLFGRFVQFKFRDLPPAERRDPFLM